VTTFDLGPDIESRRPRGVGAWTLLPPRQRVKPVPDRDLHKSVPRGVKLDLVDPVAEPVVGAKLRRVRIGLEAPVDRLLRAGQVPEVVDEVMGPARAFPLQRLAQRSVSLEQVVID
jgi:hypothetical protein